MTDKPRGVLLERRAGLFRSEEEAVREAGMRSARNGKFDISTVQQQFRFVREFKGIHIDDLEAALDADPAFARTSHNTWRVDKSEYARWQEREKAKGGFGFRGAMRVPPEPPKDTPKLEGPSLRQCQRELAFEIGLKRKGAIPREELRQAVIDADCYNRANFSVNMRKDANDFNIFIEKPHGWSLTVDGMLEAYDLIHRGMPSKKIAELQDRRSKGLMDVGEYVDMLRKMFPPITPRGTTGDSNRKLTPKVLVRWPMILNFKSGGTLEVWNMRDIQDMGVQRLSPFPLVIRGVAKFYSMWDVENHRYNPTKMSIERTKGYEYDDIVKVYKAVMGKRKRDYPVWEEATVSYRSNDISEPAEQSSL